MTEPDHVVRWRKAVCRCKCGRRFRSEIAATAHAHATAGRYEPAGAPR